MCVYVHACVWMRARVRDYVDLSVYVCVWSCVRCARVLRPYNNYVSTYVCVRACTCMCACLYVCVGALVHNTCVSLCSSTPTACAAGVYGSSLHPREGRSKIAMNNWGHEHPRRVARAIQVTLPASSVRRACPSRHILLHQGPIFLDDYQWTAWNLQLYGEIERNRTEEEALRRQYAEYQKRMADEEARRRRYAEEQRRMAEEEALRRRHAEEQRKKAEEEALRRRYAEDQRRRAEEEAKRRRLLLFSLFIVSLCVILFVYVWVRK